MTEIKKKIVAKKYSCIKCHIQKMDNVTISYDILLLSVVLFNPTHKSYLNKADKNKFYLTTFPWWLKKQNCV